MNVWTFLGDADTRWMSVAINQCCTTEDFLLFGELIGNAIAQSDRRVVLLASGGMTHRFFPFQELRQHESSKAPDNILHRESYEADQRVLAMMQDGDHAGIIDWMPEYRKAAPEGHFGHYLMMASAIGGARCQAPGEPFSEYEASVGTGQVHVWFERPADGWTGEGPRPSAATGRTGGTEQEGRLQWQTNRSVTGHGLRTARRGEALARRRDRAVRRLHGTGVLRRVPHPADRRRERRRQGRGTSPRRCRCCSPRSACSRSGGSSRSTRRRIHAAGSLYDYVSDGLGNNVGAAAGWLYYAGTIVLTAGLGVLIGGYVHD